MFRSLICAQGTVDLQLSEGENEVNIIILSEVIRKESRELLTVPSAVTNSLHWWLELCVMFLMHAAR